MSLHQTPKRGNPPILSFGKYKGVAIDKVPTSYCKWLLTQGFSEEIMYWAKRKVGVEITNKLQIEVTRHALDKYSLVFLETWDKKEGLASFIAKKALRAWDLGEDCSKNRHKDDQIIKYHEGIEWVFNKDGQLKVLITVQKR